MPGCQNWKGWTAAAVRSLPGCLEEFERERGDLGTRRSRRRYWSRKLAMLLPRLDLGRRRTEHQVGSEESIVHWQAPLMGRQQQSVQVAR